VNEKEKRGEEKLKKKKRGMPASPPAVPYFLRWPFLPREKKKRKKKEKRKKRKKKGKPIGCANAFNHLSSVSPLSTCGGEGKKKSEREGEDRHMHLIF